MKIRLREMYLGRPAGSIMEPGRGAAQLLIERGIAEEIIDPDNDGRAEGGRDGEKKAFVRPPATSNPAWTKKGKR